MNKVFSFENELVQILEKIIDKIVKNQIKLNISAKSRAGAEISDYLENSLTDRFLLSHNYSKLYGLRELIDMGYETSKNAYHNKNEQSKIIWDGKNDLNKLVSSGIYLYSIESLGSVRTKKLTFIK